MAKKTNKKAEELKEISRKEINGIIVITYEDGSVKIIPAPIVLTKEQAEEIFGSEDEDEDEEDDEEEEDEEYYESDDEDSEGGGEDDFFKMDDELIMSGVPVEDAAEDVAETIDEE